MKTVLVTGGSSYLGTQILSQLIQQNYSVRTTVRSTLREEELRSTLGAAFPEKKNDVDFFICDLESDANWEEASSGCDFLIHTASPFSSISSEAEDSIVSQAVEGTLRALRFSRDAGIERVLLTSSFGAIGYGSNWKNRVFDETDWSNIEGPNISPYIKSKTIAEQAAWDFIEREGGGLELSVINPVGIFGPVIGKPSASTEIIRHLVTGGMPLAPKLSFGIVDVRDAAALHLLAMISPKAAGQRYIANQGKCVTIMQIAEILRTKLDAPEKLPNHEIPNWLVKLLALASPKMKQISPQVGVVRESSSAKARSDLGWQTRPLEETLTDTAQSILA